FIHQLAREVWWYESHFPINILGFLIEPLYLMFYRDIAAITVSPSTRADLRALGFRGPITVVPEGVESVGRVDASKPNWPRFVYVGRLSPSKRVTDIIRAFSTFVKRECQGELSIVGRGSRSYETQL